VVSNASTTHTQAHAPFQREAKNDESKWRVIYFLRHIPSPIKSPVYPLFAQKDTSAVDTSQESRTHAIESAWLELTGLRLTIAMLRFVIPYFVENIMDHLKSVDLFSDFLYSSFNRGGYLAVLSLAGIFKLILNNNL